MRKELGPITVRIAAIVDGERMGGRNIVGERVARVVGKLQQQRQGLTVIVGSRQTEKESEAPWSAGSALSPPSSPSLTPSPLTPCPPELVAERNKLRKRTNEARTRLLLYRFDKRWWQHWDMVGPQWVYRRRRQLLKKKTRRWTPGDHMVLSFTRCLQRIEQRIRDITRRHEMLRYDRVAEKYVHWENHLREQMMIRRWGARRNAELDLERRRDDVRVACLTRRRDMLVRLCGKRD